MAEQNKNQKKRGRPKKEQEHIDINESKKNITMKTDNVQVEDKYKDVVVSVGDIGVRMKQIFGNMARNGISFQSFQNSIGRQKDGLYNSIFLGNPYIQSDRIKKSNASPVLHNKKDIREALKDVNNNEEAFKQTSMWLYYSNYVYGNLLRLYREVPQYFNYVIPKNLTKAEMGSKKFKEEKAFVDKILQKFNIQLTFKDISLQVAQEGKASYVFRNSYDRNKKSVDYAVLQKLPPDFIKYTGYGSESPLIVSFNFLMFLNPMYDISQWPDWFNETWQRLIAEGVINTTKQGAEAVNLKKIRENKYNLEGINGNYFLYIELPQDLVYTFGTDFSHPLSLPDYTGLFEDLTDLDAYKVIQSQSVLTNITSILTAEAPIDKDAKGGSDASVLSPEVIMGLESDCCQAVNSTVYPFFGPLKNFKLHQVDNIPNAMDIVLENLRNIISTAGVSGLIATTDKPSIAMIKASEKLFESKVEYLTKQYEKFLNIIINRYFDLKYEYKIVIWGGVYSWRDDVKTLKDMVSNGNIGLLPRLLSAFDTTIEDYKIQEDYISSLNLAIVEINTAEKQSESKGTGQIGRPKLEDDDINSDNTESSRDGGENDSENKE